MRQRRLWWILLDKVERAHTLDTCVLVTRQTMMYCSYESPVFSNPTKRNFCCTEEGRVNKNDDK